MAKLIDRIFWLGILAIFTTIGYKSIANAANCVSYEMPHLLEMIYDDGDKIRNRPLCLGTAISKTEVLTNVNCLPKTATHLYVRKAHFVANDDPLQNKYKAANFTSKYNIHFLFTMYDDVAKVTLNEELPDTIVPATKLVEYNLDDLNHKRTASIFCGLYNRTHVPFTLCVENIAVEVVPNSICNEILGTLYDSPIPKGVIDGEICVQYNNTEHRDSLPMLGSPLQVNLDSNYGIIGTITYFQSLKQFGLGIVTPVK